MDEIEFSVSVSQGKTAEMHDARAYTPENAEKSLSNLNKRIIDSKMTDRDYFNQLFQSAVDDFNARQRRPCERMGEESTNESRRKSYYDGIIDGTFCMGTKDHRETPVFEVVLQIGNRDDNGVTDSDFDDNVWRELKKKNPKKAAEYVHMHLNKNESVERSIRVLESTAMSLKNLDPAHFCVVRADLHADEPCGTPHLHLAFVLKGDGYKKGMKERVSMRRACEQMGLKTSKEKGYGITQLYEKMKEVLTYELYFDGIMHGYEPYQRKPDSGEHRQHLAVDVYKATAIAEEQSERRISELRRNEEAEQKRHEDKIESMHQDEAKAISDKEKAEKEAIETQVALEHAKKSYSSSMSAMRTTYDQGKQAIQNQNEKIRVLDAEIETKKQEVEDAKAQADDIITKAKEEAEEHKQLADFDVFMYLSGVEKALGGSVLGSPDIDYESQLKHLSSTVDKYASDMKEKKQENDQKEEDLKRQEEDFLAKQREFFTRFMHLMARKSDSQDEEDDDVAVPDSQDEMIECMNDRVNQWATQTAQADEYIRNIDELKRFKSPSGVVLFCINWLAENAKDSTLKQAFNWLYRQVEQKSFQVDRAYAESEERRIEAIRKEREALQNGDLSVFGLGTDKGKDDEISL